MQAIEMAAGAVLGLALIGGVFWFVFSRPPDIRSEQSRVSDDSSAGWWTGGSDNSNGGG